MYCSSSTGTYTALDLSPCNAALAQDIMWLIAQNRYWRQPVSNFGCTSIPLGAARCRLAAFSALADISLCYLDTMRIDEANSIVTDVTENAGTQAVRRTSPSLLKRPKL